MTAESLEPADIGNAPTIAPARLMPSELSDPQSSFETITRPELASTTLSRGFCRPSVIPNSARLGPTPRTSTRAPLPVTTKPVNARLPARTKDRLEQLHSGGRIGNGTRLKLSLRIPILRLL